jgi:hypothetical protein
VLGAVPSDGASIPRAMLALKAFDVGPSAVGWDWRPVFSLQRGLIVSGAWPSHATSPLMDQ